MSVTKIKSVQHEAKVNINNSKKELALLMSITCDDMSVCLLDELAVVQLFDAASIIYRRNTR